MYWKRQTFFYAVVSVSKSPSVRGGLLYNTSILILTYVLQGCSVRNKNQTIKSKRLSLKHISLGILLCSLLLSYQNLHKVTTLRKQLGLS
jgi:hypothetical protein